nr:MAG TPA: hypothetical protein [Caudoviricetes sp.]
MVMKKLKYDKKLSYRENLKLDLMDFASVCRSSRTVYLAGSGNKQPSECAKMLISLFGRTKHPKDKWGLKLKPYLAEMERAEPEAQKAKK